MRASRYFLVSMALLLAVAFARLGLAAGDDPGDVAVGSDLEQLVALAGSCDGTQAAAVRTLLKPMLEDARAAGHPLPRQCPFHPEHDMLLPFDALARTERRTAGATRCGKCFKVFRSRHYLDRHFLRKHADMLKPAARMCLANFCGIFPCPRPARPGLPASGEAESEEAALDDEIDSLKCRPASMRDLRHACRRAFRRCFHPGDKGTDASRRLYRTYAGLHCERLRCLHVLDDGSRGPSAAALLADSGASGGQASAGPSAHHNKGGQQRPASVWYLPLVGILIAALGIYYLAHFVRTYETLWVPEMAPRSLATRLLSRQKSKLY